MGFIGSDAAAVENGAKSACELGAGWDAGLIVGEAVLAVSGAVPRADESASNDHPEQEAGERLGAVNLALQIAQRGCALASVPKRQIEHVLVDAY